MFVDAIQQDAVIHYLAGMQSKLPDIMVLILKAADDNEV